jgi:3-hydroxybutyryl-CoA dehydratase
MNYPYDELFIGQKADFQKTITAEDIVQFAEISGDANPLHMDEEYAKGTIFKARIAHGLISAGFISGILGNIMPGHGTIWVRQQFDFLAPVYIGDTITATVEIIEKLEGKKVRIKAVCVNQNNLAVLAGEGIVSTPRVKLDKKF